MMRSALVVLVLLAGVARADVDWAEGRVTANGVGAADLRAPSPDIARVAAERTARKAARARLEAETRALPWAGGASVGERAEADPTLAGALAAALDAVATDEVRYQSDGSVVVRLHLELDRLADTPGAGATLVAIDARGVAIQPAVGATLEAGAARYAGPLRWVHKPPAGARTAMAMSAHAGTLAVDDAAALAAARAPIYVVVEEVPQ
jgi:hypothetical protein